MEKNADQSDQILHWPHCSKLERDIFDIKNKIYTFKAAMTATFTWDMKKIKSVPTHYIMSKNLLGFLMHSK